MSLYMYNTEDTASTTIQGIHCSTHLRASIHSPTTDNAVVNESHHGTSLGVQLSKINPTGMNTAVKAASSRMSIPAGIGVIGAYCAVP